jgi:cbb3-type cytochrome oxidase cytochrome c subunit
VKPKLGEKVMFGLTALIAVAAVGKTVMQSRAGGPAEVRDYYEWTEAGLKGQAMYGKLGCNNCHRTLGVGEMGVAPVLDGSGTRRTRDWLARYFENPMSMVPGSAHDGRLGPDFRLLAPEQRHVLTEFLFGLKAGPASRNYPRPPTGVAGSRP